MYAVGISAPQQAQTHLGPGKTCLASFGSFLAELLPYPLTYAAERRVYFRSLRDVFTRVCSIYVVGMSAPKQAQTHLGPGKTCLASFGNFLPLPARCFFGAAREFTALTQWVFPPRYKHKHAKDMEKQSLASFFAS